VTEVADVSVASFRGFYERNVHGVLGLAVALTGDRPAAEDIAQEAFLRAYRDWSRVGTYDHPDAWVRKVASNLAMSRGRRVAAETRALVRARNQRPSEPAGMPDEDTAFWRAVRALPERQAQAVALHYVLDLSVEGVADVMGISAGAVKTHLHRGRTTLANTLGVEGTR